VRERRIENIDRSGREVCRIEIVVAAGRPDRQPFVFGSRYVTAVCATVDGGGNGTLAFQPVIVPPSDAKMNVAGPLSIPLVTTKSVVELKTCPVGAPPGMVTTRVFLVNAEPATSPA